MIQEAISLVTFIAGIVILPIIPVAGLLLWGLALIILSKRKKKE